MSTAKLDIERIRGLEEENPLACSRQNRLVQRHGQRLALRLRMISWRVISHDDLGADYVFFGSLADLEQTTFYHFALSFVAGSIKTPFWW